MDKVQERRIKVQEPGYTSAKKRKVRQFKVGDRVLVQTQPKSKNDLTASFIHAWRGPYEVTGTNDGGKDLYQLTAASDLARVGNVRYDNPSVHANRMKMDYTRPAHTPAMNLAKLAPYLGPKWTAPHNNNCEFCLKPGRLLFCDWCNIVYHFDCINPLPADWETGDDWACPICFQEAAMLPQGVTPYGDAVLQAAHLSMGVDKDNLVALGGFTERLGDRPGRKGGRALSKRQLEARPTKGPSSSAG